MPIFLISITYSYDLIIESQNKRNFRIKINYIGVFIFLFK